MHDNFCRIHQTTCVTSAMANGVSNKPWDLIGVAKIVDDWENNHMRATEREFGGDTSYAKKRAALS